MFVKGFERNIPLPPEDDFDDFDDDDEIETPTKRRPIIDELPKREVSRETGRFRPPPPSPPKKKSWDDVFHDDDDDDNTAYAPDEDVDALNEDIDEPVEEAPPERHRRRERNTTRLLGGGGSQPREDSLYDTSRRPRLERADRQERPERERPALRELPNLHDDERLPARQERAEREHREPSLRIERPERSEQREIPLRLDRPERDRGNPPPRPAVRVNVPTERSPYDTAPRGRNRDRTNEAPSRSKYDTSPTPRLRHDLDAPARSKYDTSPRPNMSRREELQKLPNPTDDDLNTFRNRYQTGELFSPPRNTGRPQRQQRQERQERGEEQERPRQGRGERGERQERLDARPRLRPVEREPEGVSPIKMIFAGAACVVLVIVCILTFSMCSAQSRYREASAALLVAQQAEATAESNALIRIRGYSDDYNALRQEYNALHARLCDDCRNPQTADPSNGNGDGERAGTNPGGTTDQPPPLPPLPATVTVQSGDNLNNIARRHFGNADTATLDHIMADNPHITNRNNIPAGATLQLNPMPD